MTDKLLLFITIITFSISGGSHAAYHAAAQEHACVSYTGEVLSVVNDELFTVSVCSSEKVFKEFSYCYGVQKGDKVMFHSNPENCEMTGFTVLKNDVQCGVLCP